MKNKERIAIMLICAIASTILSSVGVYAASGYLYNADEVTYDNTNSGISPSTVQGAIDNLYATATDYTDLSNRVSEVEGISNIKNGKIEGLELNNTGGLPGYGGYIDFHYAGSSADYTSRIIETASGKLNVSAPSGIYVNGTLFESMFATYTTSLDNLTVPASNITSGTQSVARTGYKPLLVTCSIYNASSGGTASSNTNPYICELSSTSVNYIIKNFGSSAAKVKLNIQVLYVKNSSS